MAGELLAQLQPNDFFRETSIGYDLPYVSVPVGTNNGTSRGMSLQKLISAQLKEYYNAIFVVPAAVALATGLTFRFIMSDDGTSAADLGTVGVIEVTPFNLSTSGALLDWSVAASMGTATTGNVTLSSTSLNPVVLSIPVAIANLKSLAAGSILGVRVRRVGDNTSDTCPGRIVCLGAIITNT